MKPEFQVQKMIVKRQTFNVVTHLHIPQFRHFENKCINRYCVN